MLPHQQHFPLNWQDGMKISSGHFQSWESAMQDQFRDIYASTVNEHSYGLLLSASNSHKSCDLLLQQGELVLSECRAITRGGIRVEISQSNDLTPVLRKPLSQIRQEADLYAVVLMINPFKRQATGSPDPEEVPPRLPYSIPTYKLEVLPLGQHHPNKLLSQIMIGKLQLNGAQKELLDYIPPCTCVEADQTLKGYFVEFCNHLYQILVHGAEIVQKVYGKSSKKPLAQHISFIAEKTTFYISERLDVIKNQGPFLPPMYLFSQIQGLARTLDTAGMCLTQADRDDTFKFFSEFLNTRLGEWNQTVKSVLNLSYNHVDIISSMIVPLGNFLAVTDRLFHQLAELEEFDWKKREIHRIRVEEPNYFEVSNNRSRGTKIKKRNRE